MFAKSQEIAELSKHFVMVNVEVSWELPKPVGWKIRLSLHTPCAVHDNKITYTQKRKSVMQQSKGKISPEKERGYI